MTAHACTPKKKKKKMISMISRFPSFLHFYSTFSVQNRKKFEINPCGKILVSNQKKIKKNRNKQKRLNHSDPY